MKFKQTMYVTAHWKEVNLSSVDMSDYADYETLGAVEVEADFDMPSDIEIRDLKIASLKKERTKIEADNQVKIDRINDEIQSLMALEVSA